MNPRNFFAELKRRNVYKVAVAYAVVAWLLIQVATQVFPFFDIPNWAVRVVLLLLALGFPVALVLAWAFEITPEGIKRESEIAPDESITQHTGRKLIGITIAVAVAAGGMLAFQLLRPRLIAYVYAFCGRSDKAFEWLDKAAAYQDVGLSEIVAQKLFDPIHSDPRWLPFLRKIGKAPDQLAKIEFKVTLPQ